MRGLTGTNNVPLATNRRRFLNASENENGSTKSSQQATSALDGDKILEEQTRGRSPTILADKTRNLSPSPENDGRKRRKRGNRWGDATDNNSVAGLIGLPTAIFTQMSSEQLEAYTVHLRIEEISQKLKINDIIPPERIRSPSPPPQYDGHGRRINTCEFRYRKKLEAERHDLVQKACRIFPTYKVPADYRRPNKTNEKVYIPVNDYPEINFSKLTLLSDF